MTLRQRILLTVALLPLLQSLDVPASGQPSKHDVPVTPLTVGGLTGLDGSESRAARIADKAANQKQAEAQQRAEQARRQAEAQQRAEQARRQAEAQQRAEQARRQAEAQQRADQARKQAEAQQRADQARKQAEAQQRADQARKQAEAQQRADQARKQAEAQQRADQARKQAEAQQRADQARKQAEAQQRADQARRQLDSQRRSAEPNKQAAPQRPSTGAPAPPTAGHGADKRGAAGPPIAHQPAAKVPPQRPASSLPGGGQTPRVLGPPADPNSKLPPGLAAPINLHGRTPPPAPLPPPPPAHVPPPVVHPPHTPPPSVICHGGSRCTSYCHCRPARWWCDDWRSSRHRWSFFAGFSTYGASWSFGYASGYHQPVWRPYHARSGHWYWGRHCSARPFGWYTWYPSSYWWHPVTWRPASTTVYYNTGSNVTIIGGGASSYATDYVTYEPSVSGAWQDDALPLLPLPPLLHVFTTAEGWSALAEGDIVRAHDMFVEIVENDPLDTEAAFGLVVTTWFWGEADAATALLERTLTLDPDVTLRTPRDPYVLYQFERLRDQMLDRLDANAFDYAARLTAAALFDAADEPLRAYFHVDSAILTGRDVQGAAALFKERLAERLAALPGS